MNRVDHGKRDRWCQVGFPEASLDRGAGRRCPEAVFELSPGLRDRFGDSFEAVMAVEGKVYREKEGRRTVCFLHGGQEYFAKVHHGVGWRELFKNLLSFKRPVIDASNEWRALELLRQAGVATAEVVGRGCRGWNPARRQSFVITRALEERIEAEDFLKEMGRTRERLRLKRAIVRTVAAAARRMHGAGINHRDFYLCHFSLGEDVAGSWQAGDPLRVPLLDLHRAQIRREVPRRWLVKDLGALLYSSLDCGVTDRDLVAFLREYLGPGWKEKLHRDASLWRAVVRRAEGFYRRHRGRSPRLPGIFPSS